jgi:Ser/Thr protein kinase RdoA (MazF antagonist)
LDAVVSEQVWLEHLSNFVICPAPCKTVGGAYAFEVGNRGGDNSAIVTVNRWIHGKALGQDERSSKHFYSLGFELARIHNAAVAWETPSDFSRPQAASSSIDAMITDQSRAMLGSCASDADINLIESLLNKLRAIEESCRDAGMQKHVVHNDPSFGNVLFDGETPVVIDYDDMKIGYGFVDLGVVLAGPLGRSDFIERKDALFDGYASAATTPIGKDYWPIYTAYRTLTMIWGCASSPVDSQLRKWVPGQIERARAIGDFL